MVGHTMKQEKQFDKAA